MTSRCQDLSSEEWSEPPLCRAYTLVAFDAGWVQLSNTQTVPSAQLQWGIGLLPNLSLELLGVWVCSPVHHPSPAPPAGADSQAARAAPGPLVQSTGYRIERLARRGVEVIGFATAGDSAGFGASLRRVFPETVVLPSLARLVATTLSRVAPRHRARLMASLREILHSDCGASARVALGSMASSTMGRTYPADVDVWRRTLERAWILWRLDAPLRREVLSGDSVAVEASQSLRRSIARHGPFRDEESATSFVRAVLQRVIDGSSRKVRAAVTEPDQHPDALGPRISALGV